MRGLLTNYPKWRYQHLVLRHLARGYICLRGNLTDELREVGFCRDRLNEMLKSFQAPLPEDKVEGTDAAPALVPGRRLFNSGCSDLNQAIEQFLHEMTAERVDELHNRIQNLIRNKFTALLNICLGQANLVKNVEMAMQQEAEMFVSSGPVGAGIAEIFLQQFSNEEEAGNELVSAFDEAAPQLAAKQTESSPAFALLAVPPGPSGQQIFAASQALSNAKLVSAASQDDILIYRELTSLDPPILSNSARPTQTYRQMSQVDHLAAYAPAYPSATCERCVRLLQTRTANQHGPPASCGGLP